MGVFNKAAISERDLHLPNHGLARSEHYGLRERKSQVSRIRFSYNECFRLSLFVHGRLVLSRNRRASQRFGKLSLTTSPLK